MSEVRIEEVIKHYLQRWLKIPGNNLRLLADSCNASYSTLHRLSLGTNAPSPDIFSAICETICSRSETTEVMDVIAPNTANLIRSWAVVDCPPKEGKRNYVCDDKYLFSVYILCTRSNGASHGEIKETFGTKGLEYLQRLVADDVVSVREGRLFASDKSIVFNEHFNYMAISHLNAMCPEQCSENIYSTRLWVIENLNENAIARLTRRVRNLEKDIRDEVCNPENYGESTWIFTMVSNGSVAQEKEKE
ncbi:MAG: hypothetical protein M3Q07_26850 [Pseudobdellovibrionaceae bacterium]|nr:hypothetical protein [Pseudobdellovibrionaceae bacterium]